MRAGAGTPLLTPKAVDERKNVGKSPMQQDTDQPMFGPERELELLLERKWRAVYWLLYRKMLGAAMEAGVERSEYRVMVESAVMYAFADFWLRPGRWEPKKSPLHTWLAIRGREVLRPEIESLARVKEAERVQAEQPCVQRWSDPSAPERIVDRIVVEDALEQLPPNQYLALRLYYHDRCTTREIAKAMGLSIDAVDSLRSRGRQSLELLLEGQPLPKPGRPRKGS